MILGELLKTMRDKCPKFDDIMESTLGPHPSSPLSGGIPTARRVIAVQNLFFVEKIALLPFVGRTLNVEGMCYLIMSGVVSEVKEGTSESSWRSEGWSDFRSKECRCDARSHQEEWSTGHCSVKRRRALSLQDGPMKGLCTGCCCVFEKTNTGIHGMRVFRNDGKVVLTKVDRSRQCGPRAPASDISKPDRSV